MDTDNLTKLQLKFNLILQGLIATGDPEATSELFKTLDDFTIRMIDKCKYEIEKEKIRNN